MKDWEQRLDDEDAALYPVGVVADLLGVDVQLVRRYDQPGLAQPARSDSGQRRYSRRDIERLARALNLAGEGVSTPGIKRILDLEDRLHEAEQDPAGAAQQRPEG